MALPRITRFASAMCLTGTASLAGVLGTKEDAINIANELSAIVQSHGLDAGIAAMQDPDMRFSTSSLGIHLFNRGIIVADNREPELLAASYVDLADLTGEPMWPRITAAAAIDDDAMLEWYHYDTQEEYLFACHSTWAVAETVIVMVCR